MHTCLERFFKVRTPRPPALDELLQFYEEEWFSQGYESPEQEAEYKEYGKDILTKFHATHAPDFRLPIALERSFFLDINGIKVRGFIDYKTNQELFTKDYLENDLQLTIYQMAAEQTWSLPVEKLTLYHLRTNTACTCPPRDKQRVQEVRDLVLETAENIQQGKFPATENQYCPCDFPEHCPYYRHQYIDKEPKTLEQAMLPGLDAAASVERYASLQKEIKDKQDELDTLKQSIIEYCLKEKLNRVFGSEHEITCKQMERTGFNGEEIKAILEPRGLWDKVLKYDDKLLKQLVDDKYFPADIKKKIESLKHVTSAFPQIWLRKRTGEEE
jgi:putative RecB family exonuclease